MANTMDVLHRKRGAYVLATEGYGQLQEFDRYVLTLITKKMPHGSMKIVLSPTFVMREDYTPKNC